MFNIERDPQFASFENDVFSKLAEIVPPEPAQAIRTDRQLPSDNKAVTPEDALREIQELQKQGLL